MTTFTSIETFINNHQTLITIALPLFTLLSSSSGVWFYIDKFKERFRIEVRDLKFYQDNSSSSRIYFTIENISISSKSLNPKYQLCGFYKGKFLHYSFKVDDFERKLEPCISKFFTTTYDNQDCKELLFLWFLKFDYKLTNGRKFSKYYLNGELEELNFYRYYYLISKYRLFGILP